MKILIDFFFWKRWWWWLLLFFWIWMRHGQMPLVYELMHDFWKPWYLRKIWFLFFKMDEEWPNAPSLEMNAWFLEILIFFIFYFWKDDDDDLLHFFFFFFLKINEAWPNASSSSINVNFEKILLCRDFQ